MARRLLAIILPRAQGILEPLFKLYSLDRYGSLSSRRVLLDPVPVAIRDVILGA